MSPKRKLFSIASVSETTTGKSLKNLNIAAFTSAMNSQIKI
jgi:hypothetical protein